jgi:hypothetical protein
MHLLFTTLITTLLLTPLTTSLPLPSNPVPTIPNTTITHPVINAADNTLSTLSTAPKTAGEMVESVPEVLPAETAAIFYGISGVLGGFQGGPSG